MSTTVDYIECPNCHDDECGRETDNKTGHVYIFCTNCGYNNQDRFDMCPKCTAGLSFDTIEDNGALDPNADFLVHYKTHCCSEKCDYEGYAIMKMVFVHHSDSVPEV
jgi:hypothetical protein